MRVKVTFGSNGVEKEVIWKEKIKDFPQLVKFNGKRWQWIVYDSVDNINYTLIYSEIPTYDPNHYADMDDFEVLFPSSQIICECGAKYGSFSWDHMRMCKLWTKW